MNFTKLSHPMLTPELKQQYTQRLLKLRDILIDSPEERYDHSVITNYRANACGTAACAVGHAVLYHEQFPGLDVYIEKGTYGEMPILGSNPTPNWMHGGWVTKPKAWIDQPDGYFGPYSWFYIFDTEAYLPKKKYGVTKWDAIQRIEDYITQVLGCTLIEEKPA